MHYKLDFQIRFCVFDTAFHGHHILAAAEGCSVKRRKSQRYLTYLLLIAPDRHPVNGRQGVIKEMWIDLSLKRFQFKFLQGDLIDINLINKTIDLIHHSPKASDQDSHLVLTVTGYHNLPAAMIHLIHIGSQLFDFSGK